MNDELAPVSLTEHPDTAAASVTTTTLKGDTVYVVLSLEGNVWKVVKNITARSAEAAVRECAEKKSDLASGGPLTLVAVPERSWRPVKVTPKVTTSLVIEDA